MSQFSQAFTTIIDTDLNAAAAYYTALEWSWCPTIASDGNLTNVEFVGQIPGSIPNENGLRLVITIDPDDSEDPAALDYPTATFRLEEDHVPNLNAPTKTVKRPADLPPAEDSVASAWASMNDVLVYSASILDLFNHV